MMRNLILVVVALSGFGIAGEAVLGQALLCDDFTTAGAAQLVLDAEPDFAEALDPDDNEVACDHDAGDDAGRDPSGSAKETAETALGPAASNPYVDTIQAEANSIRASHDTFFALQWQVIAPLTEAELDGTYDEINGIAETWAAYPDIAMAIEAPDDYTEIDATYQGLARALGQLGESWISYFEAPIGSVEEAEASDDFDQYNIVVSSLLDSLDMQLMWVPASVDLDVYETLVQGQIETIEEELATLVEAQAYLDTIAFPDPLLMMSATFVATEWMTFAGAPPTFVAPAGGDGIAVAHADLAASVQDAGAAWGAYWNGVDLDDDESGQQAREFSDALDAVQANLDLMQSLLKG